MGLIVSIRIIAIGMAVTALVALAACATSPEDEQRQKDMEADIDEIMNYELDKSEFGEARDCLSDVQYRNMRPLGDRHVLFDGRKDKQWVNVLRGRCIGLRDDSIFIMRPIMAGRSCDKDRFEVIDSTQPVVSGAGLAMGTTCVLGEFKPVAKVQLEEIEKRLEMR